MIMNKEEAMKILKDFHDKSALFSVRTALDTIIPELKENGERIRQKLIHLVKMSNEVGGLALHKWEADEMLAWIEKQGEQKPAEWHREDEQNLNACLGYIPDEFLRSWLTNIIHIKDDKSAWSEEDEIKIKSIIAFLKSPSLCAMDGNKGIIDENIKYLKSIKDRVQSKPQYKPSDEQLYFLHWLATNVLTNGEVDKKASEILNTLYEDLKKL